MWERIARFILPLRPTEILFAADRVNQLLTRAGGDGSVGISLRQGGCERDDQKRFFCALFSRDERMSSHRPVIFRDNDLLYPDGVIDSV